MIVSLMLELMIKWFFFFSSFLYIKYFCKKVTNGNFQTQVLWRRKRLADQVCQKLCSTGDR